MLWEAQVGEQAHMAVVWPQEHLHQGQGWVLISALALL